MLEVGEAAELIGKCSARSWQRWESGQHEVPCDVDMEMYACIQIRNDLIDKLGDDEHEKILNEEGEGLTLDYYHTFEQYQKDYPENNKMMWRIHQSAVASIFSEGGNVKLK